MASFTPSRRELLAGLAASAFPGPALAGTAVDLALVLAIDVSYSVSAEEYQVQMRGTGQAFRAHEILQAVARGGPRQEIAVSAFLWSDPRSMAVLLPWTLLRGPEDALAIGNMFFGATRGAEKSTTATGQALLFGQSLLESGPKALRRVIDISTDGTCNEGPPAKEARDMLTAKGTVINGLAITKEVKDLVGYLEQEVIGGANSFAVEANDFDVYGQVLRKKLFREITNVDVM